MIGLCGPAAAAFVVTAVADGKAGVHDLLRRMARWRIGRWGAVVPAAPLVVLGLGLLAVRTVTGAWRPWSDVISISGLPTTLLPMLAGLVMFNGFGEETGWRGFAHHRLQQRFGSTRAALLVAGGWACWHAPLFVLVGNYRGFTAGRLIGFVIGIAAGALVLGHVYDRTGNSVLAAASWHTAYNLTSATTATQGLIAAISTTAVMVWAVWILVTSLRRPLMVEGPSRR
jgi:membrane protease YdiL (CAAX protease family)